MNSDGLHSYHETVLVGAFRSHHDCGLGWNDFLIMVRGP